MRIHISYEHIPHLYTHAYHKYMSSNHMPPTPSASQALYGSAMCLRKMEQLPAALKRCEAAAAWWLAQQATHATHTTTMIRINGRGYLK